MHTTKIVGSIKGIVSEGRTRDVECCNFIRIQTASRFVVKLVNAADVVKQYLSVTTRGLTTAINETMATRSNAWMIKMFNIYDT